jgi:hypothetical protein
MTENKPFSYECIGGIGQAPGGGACSGGGAYPLNVTAIPSRAVWPYVQQWSFSVQRELPAQMIASIAYVGSKGTHLTTERQINQLMPVSPAANPFTPGQPITLDICNTYDGSNITIPNPTNPNLPGKVVTSSNPAFVNLVAACFGTPGKTFPDPNTLRISAPGLGRIISLENIADSNYNAMQITVQRAKGPLSLGIAYSYSHSIDDSSDRSDSTFVNSFDLAANKASSNFDQRHLLNINYVYDLNTIATKLLNWANSPFESDDSEALPYTPSRFTQAMLLHWEVSGITTFQSGTPFSIVNGADASGISVLDNAGVANGIGAGSYPDVVGDPHTRAPAGANNILTIGPILGNPNAFAAPRGLTFGNAGRNFMNNPHRLNFDMALLKHMKVTESANLEFRAEAFNVFNQTQFRIYDPNIGNTGSNTISCYGGPTNTAGYVDATAGGVNCLLGNAFLHPVNAHRPRTMQFGLKFTF